ncbi:hypothetical protein AB0467_26320 [Streptomyces sp. NPDC052095]
MRVRRSDLVANKAGEKAAFYGDNRQMLRTGDAPGTKRADREPARTVRTG